MPAKERYSALKGKLVSPRREVGAVLVVGGGVAGMQASLDLVDNGFKVYLLDRSSAIGGVMSQLDKTFPTNDCAMCILAPKLVECGRNLNIELLTLSEIESISGEPGNFEVKIKRHPRYIDPEKCTGCGECARHCPVRAINEYNEGLDLREGIYVRYPQAVPRSYLIDRDTCVGCGLCENLCLANAINYNDKERIETIHVGAIILTPGFSAFDASRKKEYGWGKYANVVTSMQYERILSASGPFAGHVMRPSDGKIPKKIAWIQCVGSRDVRIGNEYCSAVCCMYATKQAVMTKEHEADIEPTIFYMDMRCYGKGFERYYVNAQKNSGVRFIRSRVASVEEDPETKDIIIKYETDGQLKEERFDLVVLSVGLEAPSKSEELADVLDFDLNQYSFAKTHDSSPLATTREGVFVAGAFQGPKDIPESVMQGSAAVAEAAALLANARNTLIKEKKYPEERDVEGEEPRIGVFICHCGINIGAYVNVPEVVEYAKKLKYVVHAEDNLYTCSQDTQNKIKEVIKEKKLNRVVVASCTPRTHEPLFQETLKDAGLNPYLFEMANIREQCSWIHMSNREEATQKAKDLVRMAVAKAAHLFPLKEMYLDVNQSALVIGGGVAGMTAALEIAKGGYDVFIVEKEKELGGMLKEIYYTTWSDDMQAFLASLRNQVRNNERITIYTGAEVEKIEGFVGQYKTTIKQGSKRKTIEHGVIILATGAEGYKPKEYMYGKDKRVVTQHELEEMIANNKIDPKALKRVVMIQCVGSRNDEHLYCSRICCTQAMKNAKKLLQKNPKLQLFVLNKDIRTYGFREKWYNDVRDMGGVFIRYTDDRKPEVVKEGNRLVVKAFDPEIQDWIEIPVDLLVLSTGIVPRSENQEMAKLLKVPLNEDGFFLEAHVKLRPVDFATEGVFLAGSAHSPKFVEESIVQAKAAAARAQTIISKPKYRAEPTIAAVNEEICDGCGVCEPVCEYSAIEIVQDKEDPSKKKAKVNEALCKGCGACIAACPSGAMEQKGFTSEQIYAMIEAALKPELFEVTEEKVGAREGAK
ncbi:MAG TPA: CoB--CoM heterodisulfide reductase iron-sulfur subunit A family protein [candidate division WOR-3 bacterium]|uniref:CoB--CoM heterodisulfide reductase iron-sulfur subunit A family protein n=1 Tax=candidate division WOR-3 bacterium TaxID=2052148 RepID=A0A7C0X8Q0_UNCW3|nr:CoB--CoM heterodisulfide reductase iron-sulfur subunit A family protein [candidate division WOR-3 bacterium]